IAAALRLRGKNRLYAGKDVYSRNFRRVRTFRAEYDDGLTALNIVKGYGRHILKRLTKVTHAATAHSAAPTSGAPATLATSATPASSATWSTCAACGRTS